MSSPDEEPQLDIARGDPARSKILRSSLKVLRDSSKDPEFRAMVDDILSGRTSFRKAIADPAFDRTIAEKAETGIRWFRELSDEERARLTEEGHVQIDHVRAQLEEPQEPGLDEDDGQAFDTSDPLGRRSQSARPSRHEQSSTDDEYEFDPDDPLRRSY